MGSIGIIDMVVKRNHLTGNQIPAAHTVGKTLPTELSQTM
jgi:hypothetical protein